MIVALTIELNSKQLTLIVHDRRPAYARKWRYGSNDFRSAVNDFQAAKRLPITAFANEQTVLELKTAARMPARRGQRMY